MLNKKIQLDLTGMVEADEKLLRNELPKYEIGGISQKSFIGSVGVTAILSLGWYVTKKEIDVLYSDNKKRGIIYHLKKSVIALKKLGNTPQTVVVDVDLETENGTIFTRVLGTPDNIDKAMMKLLEQKAEHLEILKGNESPQFNYENGEIERVI